MKRTKINILFEKGVINTEYLVKGWIRNKRMSKGVSFLTLNDGGRNNLQIVVNNDISHINIGSCVAIKGILVESLGNGQTFEMNTDINDITIYGDSDPNKYPIQPKEHSLEFLRDNAHLRMRTQTFNAIMRIRSTLSFAIHEYFRNKDFVYVNTPIITANDCEGAGEMFCVTTLDISKPHVDFCEDFFGKQTNLTVSGQLEGELAATALGDVYTFGPTFRAENSNTSRHLAEFWMVEPEMAFADLNDNMDLAEDFLKHLINVVLTKHLDDVDFLNKRYIKEESKKKESERSDTDLLQRLLNVSTDDFIRISYTDAVDILMKSKPAQKGQFKYPVSWGTDLQSEHERYLVEKHFKKPVIITDYPKEIKSFYMKLSDDNRTVKAMDVLFPGIGEIIGGSERENDLTKLETRMKEMNVVNDWYVDTRRYGSCPHAGFGMGFERLMLFVTGMSNIRDVIPFPRTPLNCKF